MVRLKDRSRRTEPSTTVVSIPYGTIKSCTLCRKRKVSQVSIPYGTIKRNRNNAAKPYVHSFNSLWYD